MRRREEVEAKIISADGEYCDGAWIGPESLRYLARTLADEVDALRKENERIKQNYGCARHQNTTQFCVEVAERDAVITKLLAMLEPGEKPDYPDARMAVWKAKRAFHARACEIAGRAK